MENQIVRATTGIVCNVKDIAARVLQVQEIMKGVMIGPTDQNTAGVHYGLIPGCGSKPTLLQPGAQILGVAFGFHVEVIERTETNSEGNHKTIRYHLKAVGTETGKTLAEGVGTCSTLETKYRFRKGDRKMTITGDPIPQDYGQRKAEYQKKGFGCKKIDGAWAWVKYEGSDEMVEANPADFYNTVDKISFKRGMVHVTINATACSDIFTQDIEDMRGVLSGESIEVSPAPYNKPAEKKVEVAPAPVATPSVDQPSCTGVQKLEPQKDAPLPDSEEPAGSANVLSRDSQDKIAAAFSKLNADLFTVDYLVRITGKEPFQWNPADRDALFKLYDGINYKRISMDAAAALTSLEDL